MIDHKLLSDMIAQDLVQVQKHPAHELYIYNYTQKTQYERIWNEVTLMCRGLILDADQRIVARPFAKFFNLGEMEGLYVPNEPFEVYEKMDGSLGILYWVGEEAFIATRGSFVSDQAQVATQMLYQKYPHTLGHLDRSQTYLFEIIYPDNRIVVDYGGLEDLILIAAIDKATGADRPLPRVGFPLVRQHHGIRDVGALRALEEANREGFVIRYSNGLRYKIKFEEYLRIHRIVTQVSSISIWEYLLADMPYDELLERVPDEFFNWVRATAASLQAQYAAIEAQCRADFRVLGTRKETALYFSACAYPGVLFQMLDGKPYRETIWRMLRPKFQKPFSMQRP